LIFADQALQKLEELKIFLAPSFCTLFAHPSSLQVAKFSKENQSFYRPLGFKKDGLAPYTHLG
jgi:hypothetical protein